MILAIKQITQGRTRQLGYSLFYAFLSLGYMLGGPFVDYLRAYLPLTTFRFKDQEYEVSAYRMTFAFGFILSFLSFMLLLIFFKGAKKM